MPWAADLAAMVASLGWAPKRGVMGEGWYCECALVKDEFADSCTQHTHGSMPRSI